MNIFTINSKTAKFLEILYIAISNLFFFINPSLADLNQFTNGIRQVVVGIDHSCAVTKDNILYCWGKNQLGQIWDGAQEYQPEPVQVLGDVSSVTLGRKKIYLGHSPFIRSNTNVKCKY